MLSATRRVTAASLPPPIHPSVDRRYSELAGAVADMDRIAPDADFVIYNETYRILVCKRCQIRIRSLNTHLLKTHGAELSLRRRNAIVDRFASRPLLDPKTATPADLLRPHSAPVFNV